MIERKKEEVGKIERPPDHNDRLVSWPVMAMGKGANGPAMVT